MSTPFDLDGQVAFHRQQLMLEADVQRLADQVPHRRGRRMASVFAGLLYGLASRLDESATPSLTEHPRGLITS